DIRDAGAVAGAMDGAEAVFHMAALGSVSRSLEDPLRSHGVNVDGTLRVLEEARRSGVRRVVYASSSSVYGDTPILPKHEDMPPSPRSPYAASKLAAEAYVRAYATSFGLQTVSLRFFNVFGPRQDPASEYAAVIPRFVTAMSRGERPVLFGDGAQTRDFTYVDNVVHACLLAARAGPDAVGRAYNVGCGERISLLQLVEGLNRALGTSLQPAHADPRPGDVRHSLADVTAAARDLGYRPSVTVQEGLARTVAWFAANPTEPVQP
ncbi:MAG TPA: NAD-dependent epimerase/dehydratase family protein, partial [Actinomycetota bacterium]